MDIKSMTLSSLELNLPATLLECADSGQAVVVTLPDQRHVAIQSLDPAEEDSLMDDLLESNPELQTMVAKSKASPRRPFPPAR